MTQPVPEFLAAKYSTANGIACDRIALSYKLWIMISYSREIFKFHAYLSPGAKLGR